MSRTKSCPNCSSTNLEEHKKFEEYFNICSKCQQKCSKDRILFFSFAYDLIPLILECTEVLRTAYSEGRIKPISFRTIYRNRNRGCIFCNQPTISKKISLQGKYFICKKCKTSFTNDLSIKLAVDLCNFLKTIESRLRELGVLTGINVENLFGRPIFIRTDTKMVYLKRKEKVHA